MLTVEELKSLPVEVVKIWVTGEARAGLWKGPEHEPFEPYEIVVPRP